MMEQLKLSNQICHRYYVASNAITRAYRPLLDELGLTYPQYVVLMALWEEDNVEVKQVKAKTHIDGGALSLILKKLSAKNLINIVPSELDKRIKHVQLSDKGWQLQQEASGIPEKLMCQVSNMSREEVLLLKTLTDKLVENLIE
ncbi:MarR family transcriptional regulator [Psychrosphaera sp. 1_MG-2023]|uniref:MarR family transcriptional regulator n=2 Tax=Pseudoalteromonadaceae TaxID=267888 RepID=A0ABT5FGH6_9GAMM|nr:MULTISPECIES: MarR family transcriptional regulator [unclassified Psychrosphaera]MDC2890304.1 MarR family transcriptional regulator [Psychrosphaera sp. G1-22]MDO6719674.1 MarR family transcriptional regulator [Psychrosphaera sp. 1_MG-2023]